LLTLQIGSNKYNLTSASTTGSSVFGASSGAYGTTTYFPFSLTQDVIRDATSYSVSGTKFDLQPQTFVIPSLTTISGSFVKASVASSGHACSSLSVQASAPVKQSGTLAPKVVQVSGTLVKASTRLDGYGLCYATIQLPDIPTGLVNVKVAVSGKVVDTLFVNGGAAGW
jgi:hypothetical protein